MTTLSLRARLVFGLIVVVAVGLGVAEVTTYYSVKAFMLDRVDDQAAAAQGPAIARLELEGRFREFEAGNGSPPRTAQVVDPETGELRTVTNPAPGAFSDAGRSEGGIALRDAVGRGGEIAASIAPGTYAEIRLGDGESRATFFGFEEDYPTPQLPSDVSNDDGEAEHFTVAAAESSTRFRVVASDLPGDNGAVLLVAVPLTEYDQTMARLQFVGLGVSAGVLVVLAGLAFWLVRLGLKPLGDFAQTASNIAEGDMTRRVAVTNPRTEIGRLGTAINDMLADLEEAFARRERSESQLRRFLADASHELRTPLTSIRGYAELFNRGASSRSEDLAKVMRRITQQSDRMNLIVEDLLLLARLDQDRPLELAPVDMGDIAGEVVEDARDRQPARTIGFHSNGAALVQGDPDRLYQLVNNLVTNALTHTPVEAGVDVVVEAGADGVVLQVRDDGPGISAEDREHIFEPFYRASAGRARQAGGSGLGLAIVKAIVEAHSGSVSVECPGKAGAAFSVRLPAGQPASG